MHRPDITGWLFDLYPSQHGLTVWLVDEEGRKHCSHVPFVPSLILRIASGEEHIVQRILSALGVGAELEWTVGRELYSNEESPVLRVGIADPLRFRKSVHRLERHFPHFVFFNADIPVEQLFLYSTGLFPLAFGTYRIDEGGRLTAWEIDDRSDAIEYIVPPLTTMKLRNRPDVLSPKLRKVLQIEVEYEDRTFSLEDHDPVEVLQSLNRHLQRCDPDIILTEYGDAILLPMLTDLAARRQVPLLLNRDGVSDYRTTGESSYFSYGRIVHKDGAFELAGRWHLDIENSFMMGEASLDGVVEIARMTQLPVQHQSRSTIGTALSSMQLSWAIRNGYLVPARKREPEDFKSAETLLLADRGGLIFQPVIGYHEQVAELDFVSMYPTIMVEHNVSPETVNCRCCAGDGSAGIQRVPELNYTICGKRPGIVPSTLRPVVQKRAFYKKEKKRLKKLGDPRWTLYDRRQTALKWMLVTCFGYLGYKNARFGRIEAHETVNAYSRDAILKAKEMAEARGYEFLHAIVDCMWIRRKGATEQEYEALAREVGAATGIDLSLEGIYNWIVFPASKMDPQIPTANKYVGYYSNGEIKVRGIELRRRDTPVFIKRMQGEMLRLLERAGSVAEVEALVPAMLTKAKEYIDLLRSGTADPLELVIRRHITREAEEYTKRSTNAEAVRALDEAGITLRPGEMVEYVIVDATGKKKPQKAVPLALYAFEDGYDIEKYAEMGLKAVETLLLPFGWDAARLGQMHAVGRKPVRTKKRQTSQMRLKLAERK